MHVPVKPPSLQELLSTLPSDRFAEILKADLRTGSTRSDSYPHWDKLLHLTPPAGLSREEWWLGLKINRNANRRSIPLSDTHGRLFSFTLTDGILELLHVIDQQASGQLGMPDSVTNPSTKNRYVVTSLIEESITSSQLEGASTSRRVAREMLRTGRDPQDRSERMIFNNYMAMKFVGDHRHDALTGDMLLELHRIVTDGTLDNPSSAGRLQDKQEERVRIYGHEDQVLHTPPPAAELPARVKSFELFANTKDAGTWLHPVLRAIILHFWLGYDHYFEDGNGRTARAIFYWSLLHDDYWLAEFITISTILNKAKVSYAQSFLLTETDENDLTYFILYHLDVFVRAIDALHAYLSRKIAEVKEVEALVRGDTGLNYRQRALLGDALRDASKTYTIEGHKNSHDVVYQTARTDLLQLADRGLLKKQRQGRAFVFVAAPDLSERLRALA